VPHPLGLLRARRERPQRAAAPPSSMMNSRTAQALGLAIPDKLLSLADEVMSEAQRHGGLPEMI
jgi:hypothetical protein